MLPSRRELLASLIKETKEKQLAKFLAKDFSCIDGALATRLVAELRLSKEMDVRRRRRRQNPN